MCDLAIAAAEAQSPDDVESDAPGRTWNFDLIITPIAMGLLLVLLVTVWQFADMDVTTKKILAPANLRIQTWQHLQITFWSTLLVISIAIPLGIFITREGFKKFSGPILTVANSGQAIPAYGLLVLFAAWIGTGMRTVIIALIVFGILPVLRNTMVGLEQVDRSYMEAGKGMGYSGFQVLTRIELPLAVPVILAGVRTALVINVGTAALATYIGGGALGETINSGLKLQRNTALFVGAALVGLLALTIDWLAALAQYKLKPKGI